MSSLRNSIHIIICSTGMPHRLKFWHLKKQDQDTRHGSTFLSYNGCKLQAISVNQFISMFMSNKAIYTLSANY